MKFILIPTNNKLLTILEIQNYNSIIELILTEDDKKEILKVLQKE